MLIPHLKIEKERELKDSVALARSNFLTLVPQLRPQAVIDLYTSSFAEFLFALAEHFREDLLNENERSSHDLAFLCLARQTIQGIEPQHEPSFLGELDASTRDVINRHRPSLVIDHLRARLSEPILVELAQIPLMRVIACLMQIGDLAIARAFPDWTTLVKMGRYKEFVVTLSKWSSRWNLNAVWCRDHALRVLRHWLLDEPLRWSFLYADHDPPMRNSQLFAHWVYEARHNEWAVMWSQAELSGEVLEGYPKNFSFHDQRLQFEAPGFNPVLQSSTIWKRQIELDFRIYLYERELRRLNTVKTNSDETADLENAFSGSLVAFRKAVRAHSKQMTQQLRDAAAKHGLLKVSEKRDRTKHVSWAVRYQIPKTLLQDYELEIEIADDSGVEEAAVSKAVNATLREIDLDIRPKSPKRKDNASSRILRRLGQ